MSATSIHAEKESILPQKLKPVFRSRGWDFQLIEEIGRWRIYVKTLHGKSQSFEVILPKIAKTRFIDGSWQESEPYEVYPSSCDWGTYGFTLTSIDRARQKALVLV